MPVIYYPSRPKIASKHASTLNTPPVSRTVAGSIDTSAEGLSVILSQENNWVVNSVSLSFSDDTERDYGIAILSGYKVIHDLNDYLWIQANTTLWQQIRISAGFYNGEQLAEELETQLNVNQAFDDNGVTFTVDYNDLTGLFSITPSSGTIRYIQKANTVLNKSDSVAGHLFGFTETTNFEASIDSDTPVFGLGVANPVVPLSSTTGATNLHHYHDDVHKLSIDQALLIESAQANLTVDYVVNYAVYE